MDATLTHLLSNSPLAFPATLPPPLPFPGSPLPNKGQSKHLEEPAWALFSSVDLHLAYVCVCVLCERTIFSSHSHMKTKKVGCNNPNFHSWRGLFRNVVAAYVCVCVSSSPACEPRTMKIDKKTSTLKEVFAKKTAHLDLTRRFEVGLLTL